MSVTVCPPLTPSFPSFWSNAERKVYDQTQQLCDALRTRIRTKLTARNLHSVMWAPNANQDMVFEMIVSSQGFTPLSLTFHLMSQLIRKNTAEAENYLKMDDIKWTSRFVNWSLEATVMGRKSIVGKFYYPPLKQSFLFDTIRNFYEPLLELNIEDLSLQVSVSLSLSLSRTNFCVIF
jgi:hypothetical protein